MLASMAEESSDLPRSKIRASCHTRKGIDPRRKSSAVARPAGRADFAQHFTALVAAMRLWQRALLSRLALGWGALQKRTASHYPLERRCASAFFFL